MHPALTCQLLRGDHAGCICIIHCKGPGHIFIRRVDVTRRALTAGQAVAAAALAQAPALLLLPLRLAGGAGWGVGAVGWGSRLHPGYEQ